MLEPQENADAHMTRDEDIGPLKCSGQPMRCVIQPHALHSTGRPRCLWPVPKSFGCAALSLGDIGTLRGRRRDAGPQLDFPMIYKALKFTQLNADARMISAGPSY